MFIFYEYKIIFLIQKKWIYIYDYLNIYCLAYKKGNVINIILQIESSLKMHCKKLVEWKFEIVYCFQDLY